MSDAVVVGVRVRPFTGREIAQGAQLCVQMDGTRTTLTPRGPHTSNSAVTSFSFDQSFWSHDGFEDDGTGYLRPLPGSRYADQELVFGKFGRHVLDNSWAGYHCCLFAYGQTGSGKSYSMVGNGANKGIIPISYAEIFRRIDTSTDQKVRFEVSVSMVEIYNETVQDLMVLPADRPRNGLSIFESKALGIFVEGVKKRLVDSYQAMSEAIEDAMENRTIGATLMNSTSSRAHTVLTIEMRQLERFETRDLCRASVIHLVDLAGSEKAGQQGHVGERLKEGVSINKSLLTLGIVIERLAERASSPNRKGKEMVIPYRDSKLTRLLQNALGGSSKTIMICAISPASTNYEESLSTLRYADRAKKIKNSAVVNEDPEKKLLRELREENAKLKEMLGEGSLEAPRAGVAVEALKEKQEEIARLQTMLHDSQRSFEEKLAEAQEQAQAMRSKRRSCRKSSVITEGDPPLLLNLNIDHKLSGKLRHFFSEGTRTRIRGEAAVPAAFVAGAAGEADTHDIVLEGAGICQGEHAEVFNHERRCVLRCSGPGGEMTWINGVSVGDLRDQKAQNGVGRRYCAERDEVTLSHGDRVVFGRCVYVFADPADDPPESLISTGLVSYSRACEELPGPWKRAVLDSSEEQLVGLRATLEAKELELKALRRQTENRVRAKDAEIDELRRQLHAARHALRGSGGPGGVSAGGSAGGAGVVVASDHASPTAVGSNGHTAQGGAWSKDDADEFEKEYMDFIRCRPGSLAQPPWAPISSASTSIGSEASRPLTPPRSPTNSRGTSGQLQPPPPQLQPLTPKSPHGRRKDATPVSGGTPRTHSLGSLAAGQRGYGGQVADRRPAPVSKSRGAFAMPMS